MTTLATEIETLEQGLAAMEAQRAILGDAIVDAMLAPARAKLAALKAEQAAQAAPPAERQRKHVTVLFADVSGFTAMSEQLDAEDVAATMNTLWYRLDAAITTHGGRIDKHIGDAVMALWGTDTASEDDPERAIKAALAMQAALADWRAEYATHTLTSYGTLRMRIGLNTGPVLLGAVGSTGEFTAMGDAVNVASRLEHAAPIGGILISHDTYRHVRGVFDVQQLPPLTVKGKAEPLTVYLVERAKPRTFRLRTRGVEGLETRTIGRTAELSLLRNAWHVALTERRAQVALVSGEAGVGKSRVLYELLDWMDACANVNDWAGYAEKSFWLFRGRASAEYARAPYALLRDVFMGRFEIFESDNLATAREKLTQGLGALMPNDAQIEMKAQFIGHLLGFDFSASAAVREALNDPKQIRDRAFLYTEQLFVALGQREPLVLLVEDLHWADADSLSWLEALLRATTRLPMFTVGLTRPSFFERRPTWRTNTALFPVHVTLNPLTEADSRALVAEILRHVTNLPDSLRELIVSRAEGNPFYVEELIKMLIDQRVLVPNVDTGVWRVDTTRLAEAAVPPTLTGVLQARLDRLTALERLTLQRASAIGRIFWEQAVDMLSRPTKDSPAPEANSPSTLAPVLTILDHKELIFARDTSAFADTAEYIFKHAILRDVTYETVLKPQRRTYHALAARWLAARASAPEGADTQSASHTDILTGLIAEHYELAGQLTEAAEWYARAGAEAQTTYANASAQAYYARLLPLLTEAHQQVEVLLKSGAVHELTGQWAEAEAQYRAALTLATADPAATPAATARCQHALGALLYGRGDYDTALAWLTQARTTWETLDNRAALGQTLTQIGLVLSRQGQLTEAYSHAERGLALARETGDRYGMTLALNCLGNVAKIQGNYVEARALFETCMALRREMDDKPGITESLNNLGVMASEQGDFATAQVWFAESLALRRKLGAKEGIAYSLNGLGIVAYSQNDYTTAQAFYIESLALFREMGDKRGISASLGNLGLVAYNQGDYAAARALQEESLAVRREIGEKRGIAASLGNLGLVAMDQGDYAAARALQEESLTLRREMGDRYGMAVALNNLGHIFVECNDYRAAQTNYTESLDVALALDDKLYVIYNLAGLAAVASGVGTALPAVWLAAAAETLRASLNLSWESTERRIYERAISVARAALDASAFDAAWALGARLTLDEAVAQARQNYAGALT